MILLSSSIRTRMHDWPAGVKFTALCGATILLFQVSEIIVHALVFAAIFFFYLGQGRVFFCAGVRTLWILWPFIALVLLWHYFSGDLYSGGVIVLRMTNALALANLVTMTTRLDDLMDFLRWCLAPLRHFGVRTRSVELAVGLMLRFTPVLYQKSCYIREAWCARARSKPRWRLIVPIALLALDDADHVAEALKARGGIANEENGR